MDPYVIESPWLLRKLLVSGIIVPFRSTNTSKAYKAIWRKDDPGSPLLWHSRELLRQLKNMLEEPIALAMRYGSPDISSALEELLEQNVSEIFLIPLYPQHATSTRTTSIQAVLKHLRKADLRNKNKHTPLRVMPPFYQDSNYIDALSAQCAAATKPEVDLLLFSYHGLPERQITAADPSAKHCLKQKDCCEIPSPAHAQCYRPLGSR